MGDSLKSASCHPGIISLLSQKTPSHSTVPDLRGAPEFVYSVTLEPMRPAQKLYHPVELESFLQGIVTDACDIPYIDTIQITPRVATVEPQTRASVKQRYFSLTPSTGMLYPPNVQTG